MLIHARTALLLFVTASCASRPRPSGDALPVSLVSALVNQPVGNGIRPDRRFTVGTLPPGFPATLVPPGPVRIVGGMASRAGIVAVLADSTRRITAVLEDHFEAAGFRRPPESPGSGFSPGSGPYRFFCNDSATVSAEPLTGEERNFARVSYRPARGCASAPRQSPERPDVRLALPALVPPAGVTVRGSGNSSGGNEVESRGRASGAAIVPDTLLRHYATQLVAAGWTAAPPAHGVNVAAQHFEAKDAAGAAWHGVLLVAGSGTSARLALTMERREKP